MVNYDYEDQPSLQEWAEEIERDRAKGLYYHDKKLKLIEIPIHLEKNKYQDEYYIARAIDEDNNLYEISWQNNEYEVYNLNKKYEGNQQWKS
jgi:hypothetical protein